MGARSKLNLAAINGSLAIAALAGVAAGSWLVFWTFAILLLVGEIYVGSIRPDNGRWRH